MSKFKYPHDKLSIASKLRILADWIDLKFKDQYVDQEVQEDLRRWANEMEQDMRVKS